MKKLFASAVVLVTVFVLSACSVPKQNSSARTNGLNCAFSAEMSVTIDKFSGEASVKRLGDSSWSVEFETPNTLSGVTLTFDAGNAEASYKGLSFSVPRSALPVKAMMLNLMDAVDSAAKLPELKGEDKDGMMLINGSLESGDYTITVDPEGRLAAFDMPNNQLSMKFRELTLISTSVYTDPSEEASTEEATEDNSTTDSE